MDLLHHQLQPRLHTLEQEINNQILLLALIQDPLLNLVGH